MAPAPGLAPSSARVRSRAFRSRSDRSIPTITPSGLAVAPARGCRRPAARSSRRSCAAHRPSRTQSVRPASARENAPRETPRGWSRVIQTGNGRIRGWYGAGVRWAHGSAVGRVRPARPCRVGSVSGRTRSLRDVSRRGGSSARRGGAAALRRRGIRGVPALRVARGGLRALPPSGPPDSSTTSGRMRRCDSGYSVSRPASATRWPGATTCARPWPGCSSGRCSATCAPGHRRVDWGRRGAAPSSSFSASAGRST
jgi:hypothetical protein